MDREDNIQQLADRLIALGFPKTTLIEQLDVSYGVEQFLHHHRKAIGDDEMQYRVDISRDKSTGLYYPTGYDAILVQTHPIMHGRFGDLDTSELEDRMKAIDWNRTIREVAFDPFAFKTYEDVMHLSVHKNSEAADIGNRLKVRYWHRTPIAVVIDVASFVGQYQKRFNFPLHNDGSDISLRGAYNLLSGRGILQFAQEPGEPGKLRAHWQLLDDGNLQSYPDYDFMALLKALPIEEVLFDSKGPQLIYDLITGERPLVHLGGDTRQSVYIAANPRNQSIEVYDKELRKQKSLSVADIQTRNIANRPPSKSIKNVSVKRRNGKNKGRSL